MNNEAKYWKSEYEQLRRKKKKEIELMKQQQIKFFDKTYKLLNLLGMPMKEVIKFYETY